MAIVKPKKKKLGDQITDLFISICLIVMVVVSIYPFWHVIMYSLSESRAAMSGGLFLWPREFTLIAYETLFKTERIFRAFGNTILKTAVGTAGALVVTTLTAYALSQDELKGRRPIQLIIYFTMLFSGGMIPTYLLVKDLGLLDTFWVYVIPALMTPYNMFVLRNFFTMVPKSLPESARLDGANPMQILQHIYLPLSKSALATVTLYYVQGFWNSYMDGVLYVNSQKLELLQVYLRMLISSAGAAAAMGDGSTSTITEETTKMTVIAVSIIPVILVYLFLQRFFQKGTTVGAVKG